MDEAKRARTAETPKQPCLGLKLRAPYFYPDPARGKRHRREPRGDRESIAGCMEISLWFRGYQMPAFIDLTGRRFGRLRVLGSSGRRNSQGTVIWRCLCDCGAEHLVNGHLLRNGSVASCGCLRNEVAADMMTTHGMAYTRTYSSWEHMIQRCFNPNNDSYEDYGGRGITACERWRKFEEFHADMGD
jgi:hypothetical protein